MVFAGIAAKWAAKKVLMGTIFRSWMTYVTIAIFSAFVALWLHDRWLYDEIYNADDGYITRLAEVDAQVGHCQANNQGLRREIEVQNTSIETLKAKGEKLQHKTETQLRIINEIRRRDAISLGELDSEIIGKTCDDAMAWMLRKAMETTNE